MTEAEAIRKSKVIARRIVLNEIATYDGAIQIWKQVLNKLDCKIPEILWPFKSEASAIEDYLFNAQNSKLHYDIQISQCNNQIF